MMIGPDTESKLPDYPRNIDEKDIWRVIFADSRLRGMRDADARDDADAAVMRFRSKP